MKQIIALLLFTLLLGCSQKFITADDSGSTPEGVAEVVQGNNQLAFDLYGQFEQEVGDGNIFFSPYSISVALTVAYEGARGQTAEEMETVLHIPADAAFRQPNFAHIYNQLNEGDKDYKLSTANGLWAQQDYPFRQDYTATIESYYGGRVTNLDFSKSAEAAKTINTWVEGQTNDRIKDLLDPSQVNGARLVITNAIYFKGDWLKEFDKKKTRDDTFTTGSGAAVQVPMMQLTGENARFNYAGTVDVQVLELPYKGKELSMLVILPKEGAEPELTLENLAMWRAMMHSQSVNVYLPRFTFETKYYMADTLKQMGMNMPFSGSADFSGMTEYQTGLYISEVIHQAFVEVNEEGTEAAAATAVVMEDLAAPHKTSIEFRADHPFTFVIQQKETGNILFMGRVSDPSLS